jgi:hypothetical protein
MNEYSRHFQDGINIKVWNGTPYILVGWHDTNILKESADSTLCPEDGGSNFLRNDTHLPNYGITSVNTVTRIRAVFF